MTRAPSGTCARRLAISAALVLALALGTSEAALRVLRHRVPVLRTLLHLHTERPSFDGVHDVRALLDLSPFHPQPFQDWAGFRLNSLGLRTPEYARGKAPGTYRVVALGDSFTFDSGFVPLDRMWHVLTGRRLQTRLRRPVEVINLGVPGVGPRFVRRLFQLEGRHLGADLVLFGLFVGNDLTDEQADAGPRWRPSRWSLTWRLARRIAVLARIPGHGWVRPRVAGGPGGVPVSGYVYDPEVTFTSEEEFLRVARRQARVFSTALRGKVEAWIVDVAGTVADLDREVHDAGGELVVAIIPDRVQVDDDLRRAVVGVGQEAGWDFAWVQPALSARLAAGGVTAVDLLPVFRTAPAEPPLYRRRDTHWSMAGNALAAEEIAGFLARVASGDRS